MVLWGGQAVSNLAIEETGFAETTADVRLTWTPSAGTQVYEVYRVNPDNSRELLGATPNNAYYVQPIDRIGSETQTTLEVVALGTNGVRSAASQVSFTWQSVPPMTNLAVGKSATADGYVTGETPAKGVDGSVTNNSKWCAIGAEPHWLRVDLGATYSISQFVVKHAQQGGESSSYNTRNFKIQLSGDGTNWTDVVTVSNNTAGITTHDITATSARYARLYVTKATQSTDTAARIYEFEVRGQ